MSWSNIPTRIRTYFNPPPSSDAKQVLDTRGNLFWLKQGESTEIIVLRLSHKSHEAGHVKLVPMSAETMKLCDLFLKMPFRNRGLGSALLKEAITLARQYRMSSLYGDIVQQDVDATPYLLDWYRGKGFTVHAPDDGKSIAKIVFEL